MKAAPTTAPAAADASGRSAGPVLLLQHTIGNRAVGRLLQRQASPAPAPSPGPETWAQVHQRVLKGLIDIVTATKLADEDKRLGKLAAYEEEPRRTRLRDLFESVPDGQAKRLHDRLEPGAETDDFALYLKHHFPNTRADALGILRRKYLALPPAPTPAPSGGTPAKKPPTEVKEETIGKETAKAACKLPTDVQFGSIMSETGDGLKLNLDYWNVEYVLSRGGGQGTAGEEKRFQSNSSQTAWQQAKVFLDANQDWNNDKTKLYVNITVGKNGAAGAINDAWSMKSAKLYSLDCFVAATLSQLYGLYFSYPAEGRDVAFDRDYNSFSIKLKPPPALPETSISGQFEKVVLAANIPLRKKDEIKSTLKPGDQVPITNPFFPNSSAWYTENTIYVGDDEFWGHPLGRVSTEKYAKEIADRLPRDVRQRILSGKSDLDDETRLKQYVLDNSFIGSYSRPRSRSVAPPQ